MTWRSSAARFWPFVVVLLLGMKLLPAGAHLPLLPASAPALSPGLSPPFPPPLPWPSIEAVERRAATRGQTPLSLAQAISDRASTTDRGAHPTGEEPGTKGVAPAIPRAEAHVVARARPLMTWPFLGPITSGFGPRWERMHQGIDIGAPVGTLVRAAAAGEVVEAGWRSGYGYTVTVRHSDTVATFYAHLSKVLVKPNQIVERGMPIGRVGETGRVTGPHLHFEVWLDGEPVNPLRFLTASR